MGVGLVRSLQPPDILWIHWRVYNFIANTSKWVFFLPPSDAYVRSFLYLLYTLIKLYYTHTQKAEIYVFLELSCFFHDPADVGNLISGSSAFSKASLNIWKFMVHVFLKPGLENFEHYFTSMCNECNCAVV